MTVHLVTLTRAVFEMLAAGDRIAAERLTGAAMSPWFADRIEIWQYMLRLLGERAENAGWLMQAVVLDDEVIGNAGFKGAPVNGQVELGYSIAPELRRRGHASAVVGLLLDRARREPLVDRVIARVDVSNAASIGVVTKAGFAPDGEHMSASSGRQLQYVYLTPGTAG